MIDAMLAQIKRHPEHLELATTAADIREIADRDKVAMLFGIEGGEAIESNLQTLQSFYRRGVRYLTLTWNNANSWADSCYEDPHGGLTEFGRAVVKEMNRLGMMIDISHVSDQTFEQVLALSSAPVIASHSSARALVDHPRNLSDEMLRAIAENGGVVMVNFQSVFIDPAKKPPWQLVWSVVSNLGWPETPLSMAIDHIDHIQKVAGVDHVGIGSDFANAPMVMPSDFKDVSQFGNITYELLKRGYSDEEVKKILGGNLLRVMESVEQRSSQLSKVP